MKAGQVHENLAKWRTLFLTILAILVGCWIFWTGPQTAPVEKKRPPKVVQTVDLRPSSHSISVTAYGTVIPARRVTIEPEVSGLVIRQHPELMPGGLIGKGEILFEIDSTLMGLSVKESEAAVARAQAELLEAERQRDQISQLATERVVSESEREAIESTVQIQKADLERLKAGLDRSRELLKRHQVRAPFNALVGDEFVEVGQRVNPGFGAVTLIGTDEFWVKASLPMDKLKWVDSGIDRNGGGIAEVYLATGGGQKSHRTGHVVRLLGDLEETGRMARVLVKIDDPLGLTEGNGSEPFLLNSYVRVEVEAGTLEDVLVIDRTALRENNRIWAVGQDNRLRICDVTIRWTTEESVYIDNVLAPGESLIVSSLRMALPGMEVEPETAEDQAGEPAT